MSAADSWSRPQELLWEGDKTFNIYIYDYCKKRGYTKSAAEFQIEAGIPKEGKPPIDAAQGLLFEWWSVFWLLFTAKGNPGGSSEDAVVYQTYSAQSQARNRQQAPPPIQRPMYPPNGVNGMQPQPGGPMVGRTMPNGVVINGIHHGMPVNPGPGGPQSMPFPGQPQPNGAVGQPPPNPHMPGQPSMMSNQQAQYIPPGRGTMGQPGPGQPPRPGASGPPAQYMTQPPQGSAPTPSPYPQQGRIQGGTGSAPNAPSPLGPNQQTPTMSYANGPGGRPGSRTGGPETPRSASMTHPSPSMSHRVPPQHQQPQQSQQHQQQNAHQAAAPPMDDSMRQLGQQQHEMDDMISGLVNMQPQAVTHVLQTAGLAGRQLDSLQLDEKLRLSQAMRQINMTANPRKTSVNTPNTQQNVGNRGSMHPPPTPRGVKRNSSSPATENEALPAKDQSPREAKRSRPSPKVKNEGSPNIFPGGGNPVPQPSANLNHASTSQHPMVNGIQRPMQTGQPNGVPMSISAPIPMTMQPQGPMSNLQPHNMNGPMPGMPMPNNMMGQQMGGGGGGQSYYRNAPPPAPQQQQQQQQQHHQQQQPQQQQHSPQKNNNTPQQNAQRDPSNPANQPFANNGMPQQGRAQTASKQGGGMPPPSASQQSKPDAAPQLGSVGPAPGNASSPAGKDFGGSNSAPPTTGGTSPKAGSTTSTSSGPAPTPTLSAATTTGPTTPASQPTFPSSASPSRVTEAPAMLMLQRPATTPMDSSSVPSTIAPSELFGSMDFSLGIDSLDPTFLRQSDFSDLDFTQWINGDPQ